MRFNFDTLYSFAWLVRLEPVVLSVPDAGDRYYLTPMLDMWTDIFAVPGTRNTLGEARDFLIASSSWHGDVPAELDLIVAPTPFVWVMGAPSPTDRTISPGSTASRISIGSCR